MAGGEVEAAVAEASISQWSGDGAGGRGGQEARGMGGGAQFCSGKGEKKGRGDGRCLY
jgi:hypothetical protein